LAAQYTIRSEFSACWRIEPGLKGGADLPPGGGKEESNAQPENASSYETRSLVYVNPKRGTQLLAGPAGLLRDLLGLRV